MARQTLPRKLKCRKRRRQWLVWAYGSKCAKCGAEKNLTIDHVVPICKGGGHNIENLQILCRSCNNKKGAEVIRYAEPRLWPELDKILGSKPPRVSQ